MSTSNDASPTSPVLWPTEAPPRSPLNFKVLLVYGFFRSKLWIAAFCGIGLIGGLLVGAKSPNVFEASGTLYYRAGIREGLTEGALLGLGYAGRNTALPGIVDEIMLLDDPRIYEGIVKKVGLQYVIDAGDPTEGDDEDTPLFARAMHLLQSLMHTGYEAPDEIREKDYRLAAGLLRKQTDLNPIPGTSYIEVIHRAFSAEKVEALTRLLLEAFVERHREVYGVEERLKEQWPKVEEAHERLMNKEAAFEEYCKECGIRDYQTEAAANRMTIQTLRANLHTSQSQLEQLNARIEKITSRMEGIKTVLEQRKEAIFRRNPQLESFEQRLVQLRLEELEKAASVMSDDQRGRAQERIDKLRESLNDELESLDPMVETQGASLETISNPQFYELESGLVEYEAERAGLAAIIRLMESDIERAEERREFIEGCRDEFLSRSARVAEAELEYQQQDDIYRMLGKLFVREQSGASALRIHREPERPLTKIGPNRWKPLAAGLFLGLSFGCALAVLRQLLDRKVRYAESLEDGLNVRVLGVVAENSQLREFLPRSPAA